MPTNNIGVKMSEPDLDVTAPLFLRDATVALAAELESTIGLVEASYLIGQAGNELGQSIAETCVRQLGELPVEPDALANLLVEQSAQIGGGFAVESVEDDEIVLVNTQCPFSDRVEGHPSLCMMTTNILGRVASEALGYASVTVDEALATGHNRCRVRLCLSQEQSIEGFEFFR